MTFVHYNDKIVNTHDISTVIIDELVEKGHIVVKRIGFTEEVVKGPEAVNLVMRLCPDALEGKRMKFIRNSWAIHNLIGHPLMQIFSWLGLPKLGIKIHDGTVPNPITK